MTRPSVPVSPFAARHADMQIICKSAVRESAGGRGAGDPGRTISCAARAGRLLFTDAEPVIGAERERGRRVHCVTFTSFTMSINDAGSRHTIQ